MRIMSSAGYCVIFILMMVVINCCTCVQQYSDFTPLVGGNSLMPSGVSEYSTPYLFGTINAIGYDKGSHSLYVQGVYIFHYYN
jgi:hypothetical protein